MFALLEERKNYVFLMHSVPINNQVFKKIFIPPRNNSVYIVSLCLIGHCDQSDRKPLESMHWEEIKLPEPYYCLVLNNTSSSR
jgi:hypothetical protein